MSATPTLPPATESAPTGALVLKNKDSFAKIGAIATEALSVIQDGAADPFMKSYVTACAIVQFEKVLTEEVMAPIMALHGSPLGFRTDKDKDGERYPIDIVKRAVISAVLSGLRITGNEFNIIGGNCYATVAGLERLFNGMCATPPRHEPGIVKIDEAAKRATVTYKITYKLRGVDQVEQTRSVDVTTKLAYSRNGGFLLTTDEQVVGKARRKALWAIMRELRGMEIDMAPEPEQMRNVTPEKPKTEAPALPPASAPTVEAQAFNLEGAQ